MLNVSSKFSLVNYSRHNESLNYVRRKLSSISEFFRMFKDSLWREEVTNLDTKGAKRSVKIWTTNFYKSFSKNTLLYMSSRSVHTFILVESVSSKLCLMLMKGEKNKWNWMIFEWTTKNIAYFKRSRCCGSKTWKLKENQTKVSISFIPCSMTKRKMILAAYFNLHAIFRHKSIKYGCDDSTRMK